MLEQQLVSTITQVMLSISALMEQLHISFTPSPQIYAVSKMVIPGVLNPGPDKMVTAVSKLPEFILRMSHRLLFSHSHSPLETFLFLFPTLYFLRVCIYLVLVALFHILFFLTLFLIGTILSPTAEGDWLMAGAMLVQPCCNIRFMLFAHKILSVAYHV